MGKIDISRPLVDSSSWEPASKIQTTRVKASFLQHLSVKLTLGELLMNSQTALPSVLIDFIYFSRIESFGEQNGNLPVHHAT